MLLWSFIVDNYVNFKLWEKDIIYILKCFYVSVCNVIYLYVDNVNLCYICFSICMVVGIYEYVIIERDLSEWYVYLLNFL